MDIAMTAHGASSSSSSSKLWKHDVFLRFRGEDTRKGFTGHLHAALEAGRYKTFIDEDDLKRGEEIKPELLRAIEESRISIIVFSKRYADSGWCLDELVKIMECRSKLEQHVLPIFYHVEASDIRKQEGILAPIFQKHEQAIREEKDDIKREDNKKRVEQWRKALTEAANLSGHDLKNVDNGHEAKLIQKITDENLWEWLPRTKKLHVAKFPVGINSRVQEIITDLSIGEGNKVLMVGIWGMGGLGKTTAAKAIYNQIHPKFEFKSFLDDVSNTTSRRGGLVYLQKKLISDILNPKSEISSDAEGIGLIKDEFSHRKVLVVMDNIDKKEQLDAIAGNHDWFGPGSRIIITTRDKHLLRNVDKVFLAQKLKDGESLELFSWHAFGKNSPDKEYLELSKKFVSYCDGLPLALEVLGSFLFKRLIAEWKSQLEKLKRTPNGKIIKLLRISFDGLDNTQKAIFLDISCFFIGKDKDYVAKVLDGCEFFAPIGISVLCERCLVTIEDNMLNMHDLFREMARAVISEKFSGHPGKWSRLWDDREVIDVLTNKSGTRNVEGLALHLQSSDEASFSTKAFAKMKKLRLLDLSCVELNGEYKHLPKELIWLSWERCPLKSIPDDFLNQPRLVVLEMWFSKLVQVWEGSKSLHNLKTLDLSQSWSLQKSPDFSQVPNLEELILEGCWRLSEIHPSIGHLKRLTLVNLTDCTKLISLLGDFYKSKSVETLLLNGCSRFKEVHEDIGEMISLRTLEAYNTAIREVPPSIVRLKNLTRLSLDKHLCWSISVKLKGEYKYVCWEWCPLKSIPDDFFNQDKLVGFEMHHSELVQAWEGSKSLHNLKTLDLSDSVRLKKSPDFSQVPNLEELILEGCWRLSEIHPSIGHLKRLSLVNLTDCTKLISLPGDFYKSKSVETLLLNGCSRFREVHEDIGEMISLRTLEAYNTAIREVPPSIVRLNNLTRLSLDKSLYWNISVELKGVYKYVCWEYFPLKSMPDDFFNQDKLVVLDMRWSSLVQVWEGSKSLHYLKTLDLSNSWSLQKSPDFSQVPNLEELILEKCKSLLEIHPSIGHLKRLYLVNLTQCWELISLPRNFYKSKSVETLLLNGCKEFSELHEDIGEMISLRTLEAEETAIREVPPSIGHLKRLSLVNLTACHKLISLPRDFYKLKSVETLLLNRCRKFREVHEDIGEMISLRTLEADETGIREVPPSIVGLKNLTRLSLEGTIKDLGGLINLQHLHLQGNMFHSLPNLSGLSKLETLWLNGSRYLRTVPDLPTNLKVLFADDCPALETMPDFSEMSNMRELVVGDSDKLTKVPGLDKSLNSMAWIDMHGCPNLTADFRKNILQGWTSCGFGGIALHGNYVPDWFEFVNKGNKVSFDIPPTDDRNFEGLTLFCLFRVWVIKYLPYLHITVISNTKHTKLKAYRTSTKLHAYITRACNRDANYEIDYLWFGQISNNELNLQDGDKVDIAFEDPVANCGVYSGYFVKIISAGVNLVWDKLMKENMHDFKGTRIILTNPDEGGPSHDASDNWFGQNEGESITVNSSNTSPFFGFLFR